MPAHYAIPKPYGIKYITGRSALNIPYKGVTHDWHQTGMLHNNCFSVHPGNFRGAELVLGAHGLRDETSFFIAHGFDVMDVMVASPQRAIIDWLYFSIFRRNTYPFDLSLNELTMLELDGDDVDDFFWMFSQLMEQANTEQRKKLEMWIEQNRGCLK